MPILRYSESLFQSTLPVGGATVTEDYNCHTHCISIHAPRGGSDMESLLISAKPDYFNPRSPWGERLLSQQFGTSTALFQSTLPVGGATAGVDFCY